MNNPRKQWSKKNKPVRRLNKKLPMAKHNWKPYEPQPMTEDAEAYIQRMKAQMMKDLFSGY